MQTLASGTWCWISCVDFSMHIPVNKCLRPLWRSSPQCQSSLKPTSKLNNAAPPHITTLLLYNFQIQMRKWIISVWLPGHFYAKWLESLTCNCKNTCHVSLVMSLDQDWSAVVAGELLKRKIRWNHKDNLTRFMFFINFYSLTFIRDTVHAWAVLLSQPVTRR